MHWEWERASGTQKGNFRQKKKKGVIVFGDFFSLLRSRKNRLDPPLVDPQWKAFFLFLRDAARCVQGNASTRKCVTIIFFWWLFYFAQQPARNLFTEFLWVWARHQEVRETNRVLRRGPHPATLDEQFNKEVWSDDLEFPQLFRHSHAIIPQRRSTRFALMNLSKTRSNLIVTTTRRLTDLDLHLYTELYNTISLLSIESRINSMTNVGNCVTSQTRG